MSIEKMKKKVLIVSSSLVTGGLEKCLINFCNNLDYEKYDVDLYLFNEGRDLLPRLNKNVNLLPDSPYYAFVYNMSFFRGCRELLKHGKAGLCVYRIVRTIRSRLKLNLNTVYDWEKMKATMLKVEQHYDAAVGFEEGSANYFVTECVDAAVKSCWIHTDIKMIDTNYELDTHAFEKCDYICTVSENSAKSLRNAYPQYGSKIRIFSLPSLHDTEKLFRMSKEDAGFEDGYFNVVSVGRLVELKGFQYCVEACKELVDKGYRVRWYVAGEGEYRDKLERMIAELDLKASFSLLGNCDNPYKYIKAADLCVQFSSYEGYSMVVYEEKLFGKAVVLSDIPSFREMITDGVNGLIVERDSKRLYLSVKYLVDKPDVFERLGKSKINGYRSKQQTMEELEQTLTQIRGKSE